MSCLCWKYSNGSPSHSALKTILGLLRLQTIRFCQIPITSLNLLPGILYLTHLAPGILVSSVFLEHARLTPALLSLYLECSFPGQPQGWSSHCLGLYSKATFSVSPSLDSIYPISVSHLEFQFPIPCFIYPFLTLITLRILYISLIVSWLLSVSHTKMKAPPG